MTWWAVGVMALVLAGLLLLMRLGWIRRGRRTGLLVPSVPDVPGPGELGPALDDPVEAVYVSTILAGQPLERVVAHGLGVRSSTSVHVHDIGLVLRRTGADDVFIPSQALTGVGTAAGMAGKFVGGDGLVVVRWSGPDPTSGGTSLETGLRPRRRADRARLVAAVEQLLEGRQATADPHHSPTTEELA